MNPAELYHRVLRITPSTSAASDESDDSCNGRDNGNCAFAAAHLPPAEFMRRFGGGGVTAQSAAAARAGRLSPKSRHIAKRNERRERRVVLKKLRGMVGGSDDCDQLQIIEHVINRIRELQETLAVATAGPAASVDAPASPPPPSPPSAGSGGVSPAASLDSISWASATDEELETDSAAPAAAASDSALSASPAAGPTPDGDVQLLIRQLSSVLNQLGATTQLRY